MCRQYCPMLGSMKLQVTFRKLNNGNHEYAARPYKVISDQYSLKSVLAIL